MGSTSCSQAIFGQGATAAGPELPIGDPHRRQVILDADSIRTGCSRAAFVWHGRNDQQGLFAVKREFEVGMVTLAP